MPALPPFKRPSLKNRPWYLQYPKFTILATGFVGICLINSKLIINLFRDVHDEPIELFKTHPEITRQRRIERDTALDTLHHYLGTDPEKVKQFRAEKEDYNRKIKTIREERARMREELEKLQAEQLKKE